MTIEKITDKTKVSINGFCYTYRDHSVVITPGFCGLDGEIYFNNSLIDSGFCGYGLKTAIKRINARIDKGIEPDY